MKILVVQAHPNPDSFTAACAAAYAEASREKGNEVRVIDLAEASFDPVLRFGYQKRMPEDAFITQSQESLLWAEHVSVFFPTWWGTVPSVFSGWVERVFTPGITYRYIPGKPFPEKLLTGKTASLVTSSHAPSVLTKYAPTGPVRHVKAHILSYCGINKGEAGRRARRHGLPAGHPGKARSLHPEDRADRLKTALALAYKRLTLTA
ncbi:NAD(P)H-dependent oxidoreductase [Dermabacteraceae bacterium TAE3-ERU27]|nr:NAD(P)H-dependent oxidoreductase [Dermabacteraceae bacterium TAE3-ERU27]